MNYHHISKDDMLNGEGLRVVLWVAGCEHHCKNCQNPETHDPKSGIPFDDDAEHELLASIVKDHIDGLTLSGGDPLFPLNRHEITTLCEGFKKLFPHKTIWLYTGYTWEQIKDLEVMQYIDVLVDGRYVEELADIKYEWAGSTNQRIIDVQKSLELNEVVLHKGV